MKRATVHLIFGVIAGCFLVLTLWQAYKKYAYEEVVTSVTAVPDTLDEYNLNDADDLHPAVVLKTANALSAGGDFESAESLYVKLVDQKRENSITAASRFNLANHYLREGLRSDLPGAQARPLVAIAKQRYRDLLLVAPDHWGARVNLEHALRFAPEQSDKLFDKRPPVKSVNVVVPDFTLKDLP